MRLNKVFLAGLMFVVLSGCTTHYIVKDSASGTIYYTTEIEEISGGAFKLTDQKTSAVVTVQNPEVTIVNGDEYRAGLNAPRKNKIKPFLPVNRDETPVAEPAQK